MIHQRTLPAGLDGNSVELFAMDNKPMALYKRRIISFWDLPENIVRVFFQEMNSMPNLQRYFKLDMIEDKQKRLEKFVCLVYGKFDNIPDYDGKMRTEQELEFKAACETYKLTLREVEILMLISLGHTDKDIAGMVCISSATVAIHRHKIHEKIHTRNAADITRFACKKQLV